METGSLAGLYQQIIEGAQDAIIFADKGGTIRLWNSGAEAIFGYSAEQALGRTLDLIVPEKMRELLSTAVIYWQFQQSRTTAVAFPWNLPLFF